MGADLIGIMLTGPTKLDVDEALAWFDTEQTSGRLVYEVDEEECEMDREEFESFLREFAYFWKKGSRDSVTRSSPYNDGHQIIFAGELSWGDEPEGYGYQMLKKFIDLGIPDKVLQIK